MDQIAGTVGYSIEWLGILSIDGWVDIIAVDIERREPKDPLEISFIMLLLGFLMLSRIVII